LSFKRCPFVKSAAGLDTGSIAGLSLALQTPDRLTLQFSPKSTAYDARRGGDWL